MEWLGVYTFAVWSKEDWDGLTTLIKEIFLGVAAVATLYYAHLAKMQANRAENKAAEAEGKAIANAASLQRQGERIGHVENGLIGEKVKKAMGDIMADPEAFLLAVLSMQGKGDTLIRAAAEVHAEKEKRSDESDRSVSVGEDNREGHS